MPTKQINILKKLLRAILKKMPRNALTFNIGKVMTRTIFKPETEALETNFLFGNKIQMTLDLSEFASNDLYCLDNRFESTTLKLWERLSEKSNVIIDMGSHIGTFALVAASLNPKAKIIAVEICKRNLHYLTQNAAAYKNIQIHQGAIGMEQGTFLFQEDFISGGGYLKTMDDVEEHEVRERHDSSKSYEVEAITPAQLCKNFGIENVDLIKIDLEGLEYFIMTGQADFWDEFAPKNVIVEIGIEKTKKEKLQDILTAMKKRGYSHKRYQGLYAFPWKEKEDLANWYFWK